MKTQFYNIIQLSLNDNPIDTKSIQKIVLYNDIDTVGTVMELFFNDKTSLMESLPIIGGEELHFVIEDNYNNEIDLSMILTEFKIISQKDGLHSYVYFRCIEKNAFIIANSRINKYYEQRIVTDIVKDIYPKIEYYQSSTAQKVDIMIPDWSITKAINYLADIAYSDRHGAFYQFYQIYDTIYFRPLNEIYKTYEIKEINKYQFNKNQFYRYGILDFKRISDNNVMDIIYHGTKKRFIGLNQDTKEIIDKTIILDNVMEDLIELEESSILNNDLNDIIGNNEKLELLTYFDERSTKAITNNKSVYKMFQKEIEILLNGDFDLKASDVIFLDIQNVRQYTENSYQYAGNWLVTKIAYHISDGEFKMKVRLSRESLYDGTEKYKGKVLK